MLIQITNHCTLECPHCMQNSTMNCNHMSEEVFRKTLEFGCKIVVINDMEDLKNELSV